MAEGSSSALNPRRFMSFGSKDKEQENPNDAPPIQPSIARNLTDKVYEKRKLGALEVRYDHYKFFNS